MAAFLGNTEIGFKKTGTVVTVANDPKAKLMYYLSCITTVLETEKSSDLQRLSDYRNFRNLSESDTDNLILLCVLVSPDELMNKCIFQDADLCGDYQNEFYELSAVSNRFVVTNSIMIGGQQKRIHKIMACKPAWLTENWIEPMGYFKDRLQRITGQGRRETSCVII